jgi:hypothetical protein
MMGSKLYKSVLGRKKLVVAIALIVMAAVPIRAYAWNDSWWLIPTQAKNIALWALNHSEELGEMAADLADKIKSTKIMEVGSLTALDSSAGQISSTIEKQNGALGELSQAHMNYDATRMTSEGVASAEDRYGSNEDMGGMCDITDAGERVATVASGTNITAKALSTSLVNRDLTVLDQRFVDKELINTHANKYCSDLDAKRGRCDAVDDLVQNADVQASTLLVPSNGTTYTQTEANSARDFIRMVAPPVKAPVLPAAIEKSVPGTTYLVQSRAAAAQMSVPYYSLSHIWASRLPDPDQETPSGGLSLIGMMRKVVYDKFVDPQWKTDLAKMDSNATLREIAVILSSKNFNTYQHYRQTERLEALLATRLSVDSSISNGKRIEKARRAITGN